MIAVGIGRQLFNFCIIVSFCGLFYSFQSAIFNFFTQNQQMMLPCYKRMLGKATCMGPKRLFPASSTFRTSLWPLCSSYFKHSVKIQITIKIRRKPRPFWKDEKKHFRPRLSSWFPIDYKCYFFTKNYTNALFPKQFPLLTTPKHLTETTQNQPCPQKKKNKNWAVVIRTSNRKTP